MVRRQAQRAAVMLERMHLANAVVPDMQHPAQAMARPDSVTRAHTLDRHRAMLGLDWGALGHAPVATGTEALDVVWAVGTEHLGLGP